MNKLIKTLMSCNGDTEIYLDTISKLRKSSNHYTEVIRTVIQNIDETYIESLIKDYDETYPYNMWRLILHFYDFTMDFNCMINKYNFSLFICVTHNSEPIEPLIDFQYNSSSLLKEDEDRIVSNILSLPNLYSVTKFDKVESIEDLTLLDLMVGDEFKLAY